MNLLRRLTSAYNKEPTGIIGKIFSILTKETNEIEQMLNKIEYYRDIDKATGKTLDEFGRDVRASRRGFNDVDYRLFIKIKTIANLSGGEIETLNEVLPVFMKGAFLGLQETWKLDRYNNEPAAIVIKYDDDILFKELEDEYEETESDPYFLDGSFLLDGERELNGGIVSLLDTFDDRLKTIEQLKKDILIIVGGGIHVYFEVPTEIVSKIKVNQNAKQYIKTLARNRIDVSNDVNIPVTNKVEQSAINRLDGTYYLDGEIKLDAKRDFIVNDVLITEVSA